MANEETTLLTTLNPEKEYHVAMLPYLYIAAFQNVWEVGIILF